MYSHPKSAPRAAAAAGKEEADEKNALTKEMEKKEE